MKRELLAIGMPGLLLTLCLFSISTSGANSNRIEFTQADLEAAELCVDCHDDYAANLSGSTHAIAVLRYDLEIMCISCHSGAGDHVEDPGVDNIGNPSSLPGEQVHSVCTQCHLPHMELDNTGFDPHIGRELSCTSCHSVHSGSQNLLLDDKSEFCGNCHTAVKNQFMRRSNHPVADGNVSCLSCHDFTGKLQPVSVHRAATNCYSCHPMEGAPHLYEHESASDFSTEGAGCTACHMPHGSPNERLLTRPNNSLCQQCHGTPPRHVTAFITMHRGLGGTIDCMECHSEVHGSNDNRFLLDPNLGAKIGAGPGDCFCHNVDG